MDQFYLISIKFIFLFCLMSAGLSSCATQEKFIQKKNVNASVEGLIKAFDHSTLGIRGKSANGRELVSKYQGLNGEILLPNSDIKNRAYSRLRILGSRRPYTLQVQYIIEKLDEGGAYSLQGYDEAKAQKILKKIMDFLVTRRDREDFIDDFRPF